MIVHRQLRRVLFSCILLGLALPVLSAQNQITATWPRKVTDANGNSVTLVAKPSRIVSLAVYLDEFLVDLVPASRIAALSVFSTDPQVSNVVAKANLIKHHIDFSVEAVLALKPDLVLLADWSDLSKIQRLRELGVPVWQSATPLNLSSVEALETKLAGLVGEEATGAALIKRMHDRLAKVDHAVAALPPAQRLHIVDWGSYGTASGTKTSWDQVVTRAGFINAVAGFPTDHFGQVALSKEGLITLNPDVLVLPSWAYNDPKGPEIFLNKIQSDPAYTVLRARNNGRIIQIPEPLRQVTSPYMVDAIEYLLALHTNFSASKAKAP